MKTVLAAIVLGAGLVYSALAGEHTIQATDDPIDNFNKIEQIVQTDTNLNERLIINLSEGDYSNNFLDLKDRPNTTIRGTNVPKLTSHEQLKEEPIGGSVFRGNIDVQYDTNLEGLVFKQGGMVTVGEHNWGDIQSGERINITDCYFFNDSDEGTPDAGVATRITDDSKDIFLEGNTFLGWYGVATFIGRSEGTDFYNLPNDNVKIRNSIYYNNFNSIWSKRNLDIGERNHMGRNLFILDHQAIDVSSTGDHKISGNWWYYTPSSFPRPEPLEHELVDKDSIYVMPIFNNPEFPMVSYLMGQPTRIDYLQRADPFQDMTHPIMEENSSVEGWMAY